MDNLCVVHGDVEGKYDLRVKAKFDDGSATHNLLLNKKATEDLMGFSLDEAIKMGEASVLEKIEEYLGGKRFEIKGDELETNFLVKDIRRIEEE